MVFTMRLFSFLAIQHQLAVMQFNYYHRGSFPWIDFLLANFEIDPRGTSMIFSTLIFFLDSLDPLLMNELFEGRKLFDL